MSAEIINLRQRRKRAGREAARRTGDANAARHGRSKAERALEEARADRAARELDGHRMASASDPDDGPDDG